jgi:hypothetical protein
VRNRNLFIYTKKFFTIGSFQQHTERTRYVTKHFTFQIARTGLVAEFAFCEEDPHKGCLDAGGLNRKLLFVGIVLISLGFR